MSISDQKLNNTLASKLDSNSHRARNNAMGMTALVASIGEQEAQVREGGGEKAIEAQHAKKRLTARERLRCFLIRGRSCSNWVSLPLSACMRSGAVLPQPGW